MKQVAVLTADVVNSTQLGAQEQPLIDRLKEIVSGFKNEFYRGDSFQVFLPDINSALPLLLLCRTAALSVGEDGSSVRADVRAGIGLGNVEEPITTLGTAKGEAFVFSGRSLDNISKKGGRRLFLQSAHPLVNISLDLLAQYVDSIFNDMTVKQAEVIHFMLQGYSQQEITGKLQRSKSTIHQHVSTGRWSEIQYLVEKYKQLTEYID